MCFLSTTSEACFHYLEPISDGLAVDELLRAVVAEVQDHHLIHTELAVPGGEPLAGGLVQVVENGPHLQNRKILDVSVKCVCGGGGITLNYFPYNTTFIYLEIAVVVNLGVVSEMKALKDSIHLVPPDRVRHQLIPAVGLALPQHLPPRNSVVPTVQQHSLSTSKKEEKV